MSAESPPRSPHSHRRDQPVERFLVRLVVRTLLCTGATVAALLAAAHGHPAAVPTVTLQVAHVVFG